MPESSYCQRDVSCTKTTLGAESLCTQTLETHMNFYIIDRKTFPKYFVLQSLHKGLPSTTLYYTACTSTSQYYYFVPQSLQKVLPSTTLYYEARARRFPVVLCTTKLAQSTSQYYLVPQSLQKVLPSTTLYDEARARRFPVVLCTTKLAQSTSQYYFVKQSFH